MFKLTAVVGVFIVCLVVTTKQQQQQQCRFEWNEQTQGPNLQISGLKGDPGPAGRPGKRGFPGPEGSKGNQGALPDEDQMTAMITRLVRIRIADITEDLRQTIEALTEKVNQQEARLNQSFERANTVARHTCEGPACEDGWQVFQHRYDGSVDFNRSWVEYKNGFGSPSSEFWLGLEKLHQITSLSTRCRLRIELWDFSREEVFAEYNNFSIGDEGSLYQLGIADYHGTAGDSVIKNHNINGLGFTTFDRDNDRKTNINCAEYYGGPWWHRNCAYAHLNSLWSRTSTQYSAISWYHWKKAWGGIMETKMKVKCV